MNNHLVSRTDEKHLIEVELESTQAYHGHLLDVRVDRVRQPDGREATREYIRHQGAVVVVPILDNGELVFERQFRYPLRRVFLEFPAGKIEAGEDVLMTGQRELLEETGYMASDWRHLGVLHPCIGYSDERIEIFSARGLQRTPEGQRLDEGEFVELLTLSLDTALEAVRHGEITDGKTIAALFWAEKIMRSGW
ncbi:NUDIX domain-containing protein [Dentiradicibacter hellwigii]|jgi:hydrolase, NUDIX family|uniref:GDP-mannose pyrophosphatase n=1 Tax=Dentiradicibacter hellwigii TaxID=3149053 RepID=A0ABV4UF80_9RHOO